VYSKWNPEDAANDFINKVKNIGRFAESACDAPLVSVILDGENCWEYYQNDGWDFLTALYEKLSGEEEIETVRISDYLEKFPPKDAINSIESGFLDKRKFWNLDRPRRRQRLLGYAFDGERFFDELFGKQSRL